MPGETGGPVEGQGVGNVLAAGVAARKQEILSAEDNRLEGALGRVVVDGDAAVLEEQCEGVPTIERVAHRLGEVALPGMRASCASHQAWKASTRGLLRSEERRVGKECVCTCRYRWSPYN